MYNTGGIHRKAEVSVHDVRMICFGCLLQWPDIFLLPEIQMFYKYPLVSSKAARCTKVKILANAPFASWKKRPDIARQ